MKHLLLISFLLIRSMGGFAQQEPKVDSLVREMCITIKTQKRKTDSLTLINCFKKHLSRYEKRLDDEAFLSLQKNCYYRLQRECPEFKSLLDRIDPNKGDFKKVDKEPESKISQQQYSEFFNASPFKYLEQNADTTRVVVTDSTWTDYFLDGTYSKLSLVKTNDFGFILTFIESNNETRKGFSKPGDKFRYKILRKFDTYYELFATIPGSSQMLTFKLYF